MKLNFATKIYLISALVIALVMALIGIEKDPTARAFLLLITQVALPLVLLKAVMTVNEKQVAEITMNTSSLRIFLPGKSFLLILTGLAMIVSYEAGWLPAENKLFTVYGISAIFFVFGVILFWDQIQNDLNETPGKTISHFVEISTGKLYHITGRIDIEQAKDAGILHMSVICENEDEAISTAVKETKQMHHGSTLRIKDIDMISHNVVLANSTEELWIVTAMYGKAGILVGATDVRTAKDVGLAAIYKDLPFSGEIDSARAWKAPKGRVIALPPQLPIEVLDLILKQKDKK